MAVTWNGSDKSANITLSGGNLTATTSSATQGAVRATSSFSSGKLYFEAQYQVLSGSTYAVGWANSTAALGTAMGSDKNSCVVQGVGGAIRFNNANQGSGLPGGITLQVVCVAFDIGSKLIWFRNDLGLWNGSLTANPATGTGGIDLSTANAGPYFPVFAADSSGASVIANFGATDFDYAVPSGFSGLDTDAQAYAASSKFLGYTVLGPPENAAISPKFLGYTVLLLGSVPAPASGAGTARAAVPSTSPHIATASGSGAARAVASGVSPVAVRASAAATARGPSTSGGNQLQARSATGTARGVLAQVSAGATSAIGTASAASPGIMADGSASPAGTAAAGHARAASLVFGPDAQAASAAGIAMAVTTTSGLATHARALASPVVPALEPPGKAVRVIGVPAATKLYITPFAHVPAVRIMRNTPVPAVGPMGNTPVPVVARLYPAGPQPVSLEVELVGTSAQARAIGVQTSFNVSVHLAAASATGMAQPCTPV